MYIYIHMICICMYIDSIVWIIPILSATAYPLVIQHSYGKSTKHGEIHYKWSFSMAIFKYRRVYPIKSHETTIFLWFSMVFLWFTGGYHWFIPAWKPCQSINRSRPVQSSAVTQAWHGTSTVPCHPGRIGRCKDLDIWFTMVLLGFYHVFSMVSFALLWFCKFLQCFYNGFLWRYRDDHGMILGY